MLSPPHLGCRQVELLLWNHLWRSPFLFLLLRPGLWRQDHLRQSPQQFFVPQLRFWQLQTLELEHQLPVNYILVCTLFNLHRFMIVFGGLPISDYYKADITIFWNLLEIHPRWNVHRRILSRTESPNPDPGLVNFHLTSMLIGWKCELSSLARHLRLDLASACGDWLSAK